jgi:hypothetical protein
MAPLATKKDLEEEQTEAPARMVVRHQRTSVCTGDGIETLRNGGHRVIVSL